MEIMRSDSPNASVGMFKQATIEERLVNKKASLEHELKEVNEALEALRANPGVMHALNLISKIGY
jgi:hypothetical protein